jgi:hypothetical protein
VTFIDQPPERAGKYFSNTLSTKVTHANNIFAYISTPPTPISRSSNCIQELSEEERTNPNSFFWKNKHDLIYTGINVSLVKAFLAHKKIKDNGNTFSHVQLHKYNDAVLYGTKQALPVVTKEGVL